MVIRSPRIREPFFNKAFGMGTLITRITMQGIVGRKSGNRIWVVPFSGCMEKEKTCTGGCGACSGEKNHKKIQVDTPVPERLTAGDPVTVRYFALNEFIGALIVFGVPLFTAVSLLLSWYSIDPSSVESGWALLSAGGALLCGFAVVWLVDRIFRKHFPPELVPSEEKPVPPQPERPVNNG